jgi:hypothetical protein
VKIALTEVLITSVSTGEADGKKTELTQNISFHSATFRYEVNGTTFAWDIAANDGRSPLTKAHRSSDRLKTAKDASVSPPLAPRC